MNQTNPARGTGRRTGAVRSRVRDTETGSASLELAVNVVGFGLLLALILLAGRVVTARQVVETAAYDAARTASITRDITLAPARAQEAAAASLANQDLTCVSTSARVDTSRYSSTPGEPSQITVTVSCEVSLADLALGPVTHTVSRAATSPVDSWRSAS
jgi:Flp pilus assembly protein TadG